MLDINFSSVVIYTNFNCNLRCKYCNVHSQFRTKDDDYDIEDIKKDILHLMSLENSEIKEFVIIGGEPLLYPHLKELLEFLSKFNKRIVILTNGVLLKQCDFLLKYFNKNTSNKIAISNYKLKNVLDFYNKNKDTLNIILKPISWCKIINDYRISTLNHFKSIEFCCRAVVLYKSKICYCSVYLSNSFFIKHPENFKDLQMDIKSFKSYNEILKFLNKRNKICNGCNFWSRHPWEQGKYDINEVLIQ